MSKIAWRKGDPIRERYGFIGPLCMPDPQIEYESDDEAEAREKKEWEELQIRRALDQGNDEIPLPAEQPR